jgi:hypothetical protein
MRTPSLLGLGSLLLASCSCGSPGAPDDSGAADAPAVDAPGADAPTELPDAADVDTGGTCSACLDGPLLFGRDGGLACYRDTTELSGCATFTQRRMGEGCGPGDTTCTNEIPQCPGGAISVDDVRSALAHPDVVAALAAAPILYGRDTRPADGQVFYFEGGGRRVEVGLDCTMPGCTPIPAGVRALETLLEALMTQQLARPGCEAFTP